MPQNTSKKTFSDQHLARLSVGAQRRADEQLVGNYIRKVNRLLFATLLSEATQPKSAVLDGLVSAIGASEAPLQAPPSTNGHQTMSSPPPLRTIEAIPAPLEPAEEAKAFRPPPPRMNID